MRFLLCFFLATSLFGLVFGSEPAPNRGEVERAIAYLHLDAAEELSQQLPTEKERIYYRTRCLFLRYISSESPDAWEAFGPVCKSGMQQLSKLSDRDPEKNVMLAELYFLRGAGKMLHQKYVGAALDVKNACSLLDDNQHRFPNNIEQRKLLGIFHVAMGSIPRKLRWLSSAVCFRGDLDTGLAYLKEAATQSQLLPMEAEVLLYYCEKNLLSVPEEALTRVEKLSDLYPSSKIVAYLRLSVLLELHRIDAALDFCAGIEPAFEADKQASKLPIWDYSRAKAHYFRLDFRQASYYFDRFLENNEGKTLQADAMFRKGMALALQDDYPQARRVFHELVGLKSSTFDEDEYARHMASIYRFRAPSSVEMDLFRARNLFDGGYYDRSIGLLEKLQAAEINANERTELYYRLGRNHQAKGSNELAKQEYLNCVKEEPGHALWMKVYAHYYLGQLYEIDQSNDLAREQYEIALSYDDYEYQSGLEQRTKAALHQLRRKSSRP